MTRVEEIKQIASILADTNVGVYNEGDYTDHSGHNAYRCAYEEGAVDALKWADEHPKNPWMIFPKDIPNDGQEVILTWKKSGAILKALFQKEFVNARGEMVKNIFRLEHEEYKGLYSQTRWHDKSSVRFWMPIPDL